MADQLIQSKTMDSIEAFLAGLASPPPATHPVLRTFEENANSGKHWIHLHSPGVDDEVELGIGLWPVRIEFRVVTDKDESTSTTLHETAISRVSVGMLDPDAADDLSAAVTEFTCYDVIPTGVEEEEIDDRKFITTLSFNLLVMLKNI